MLDRQLSAILGILNDISDGSYKIIDAEDIISKLADSDRCTKVELSGLIRTLSDNEYIKVKYSTADEYCLTTLAKARTIERVDKNNDTAIALDTSDGVGPKSIKEIKFDSVSLRRMIRKAAFLGALLGGLLTSTVALLIGMLLKLK